MRSIATKSFRFRPHHQIHIEVDDYDEDPARALSIVLHVRKTRTQIQPLLPNQPSNHVHIETRCFHPVPGPRTTMGGSLRQHLHWSDRFFELKIAYSTRPQTKRRQTRARKPPEQANRHSHHGPRRRTTIQCCRTRPREGLRSSWRDCSLHGKLQ